MVQSIVQYINCVYRHKIRKRRTLLSLAYGGVFALSCCCPAVAGAGVLFDIMHGPGAASASGVLDARTNAEVAAKAALGQAPSVLLGPQQARPVFGLAMGLRMHLQAPVAIQLPMASWLKTQPAAAAAAPCAPWELGHAGGRGRWQQRPAGLQPNCGWHWHSAMSVCYIRVCLGFFS